MNPRPAAPPSVARPAGGAAAVALVFLVAMAFATVPTPLYALYQARLGLSTLEVTLVFAAYAVGVIASLGLAGHVSDWVGRRRLLTIGLAVELASALLFALWPEFGALVAARVLNGVAVGLITATASAYLVELRLRANPSGGPLVATLLAGLASLGGFALGPLLSAVIAENLPSPLTTPYLVFAGALALGSLALRLVPETVALPVTPRIALPRRPRLSQEGRRTYTAARIASAAAFSILGLFSSVAPGFVARLAETPSLVLAGSVAFLVFGASAVAQILLARLPDRIAIPGGVLALTGGLAVTVAGLWASAVPVILTGGVLAGIGGGLLVKVALATATGLAAPHQRAEALTGVYLAGYLGLSVPIIGVGIAVQFVSPTWALTGFAVVIVLPLVAAAPRLLRATRTAAHPGARLGRGSALTPSTGSSPAGSPGILIHRAGTRAHRRATAAYHLGARPQAEFSTVVRSPEQVVAALQHARSNGLGVGLHSTGHGTTARARTRPTLQLRVELDGDVTVDPVDGTARIPAGARWNDVVAAAAPFGLAAPHGSSGDVGAVGYLLRGGLSFYGREFGLASDSILSIELVRADGHRMLASATLHPELFWALRGGGGGFGVVIAVTIALRRVAAVVTGTAFWSLDAAPRILDHWAAWTATAPTAITTSLRIVRVPPFFGMPRALTRARTVCVDGAVIAQTLSDLPEAEAIAAALLDPLRELATPLFDSWKPGRLTEVPATHMDPSLPAPAEGDHLLLGPLDAAGRRAFLEHAADPALTVAELRQLGGHLTDPVEPGGAVDRLHGDYSLQVIGLAPGRRTKERLAVALAAFRQDLQPYDTGFTLPNFADREGSPQRSFDDTTAQLVARIRSEADPAGLFADDVADGALVRQRRSSTPRA